jgi:hypothetical protein
MSAGYAVCRFDCGVKANDTSEGTDFPPADSAIRQISSGLARDAAALVQEMRPGRHIPRRLLMSEIAGPFSGPWL